MDEQIRELMGTLKDMTEELFPDAVKFDRAVNKSAATRMRKSLQEVKKLAQGIRVEILERTKRK